MVIDVVPDGTDQIFDAAEDTAMETLVGEVPKEPLRHVQPRAARGSEMHAEAGAACQPFLCLGVFMCGVVVGNQMDLLHSLRDAVDNFEEQSLFHDACSRASSFRSGLF